MNGSSASCFGEPYQGTIDCDVIELKDFSKRGLKKIYIVTKLIGNGKNNMEKVSCSYSQVGGRFIPKDRRSESSFQNITIKKGLEIGIDFFIKQTFGRKSVGSVVVNVLEVLRSADSEKELYLSVSPAGQCLFRIRVTPPPREFAPSTADDADPHARVSHQVVALAESDRKHMSISSARDDDKDADAPHHFARPILKPPLEAPKPANGTARTNGHAHTERRNTSSTHSPTRSVSSETLHVSPPEPEPPPGDVPPWDIGCKQASVAAVTEDSSPATGNTRTEIIATGAPAGNDMESGQSMPLPVDATLPPTRNTLQHTQQPSRPDMIRKSNSEEHLDPSGPSNASNSSMNSGPLARGIKKSASEWHIRALPVHTTPRTKQLSSSPQLPNETSMEFPRKRRHSLDTSHRPSPAAKPERNSTGSMDIDAAIGRLYSFKQQGSLRRQDSLKRQTSASVRGKLADGVNATDITSSRVSRELMRKLSDTSLVSSEMGLPENSGGKVHKYSVQRAALSWLEQQVVDSGESTAPHSVGRTPNSTMSESPQSTRITPSPCSSTDSNNRRSARALFLPSHSTIQEETENETVVSRSNIPARKRLTETDPGNESSITVDSTLEEYERGEELSGLSLNDLPGRNSVRGRRCTLSTTIARARFDDTSRRANGFSNEIADHNQHDRLNTPALRKTDPGDEGEEGADIEGRRENDDQSDAQEGEGEAEAEEDISSGDSAVPDTVWIKRRGSAGIRATRSTGRRGTIGGRKQRGTNTMRSVQQWDEKVSVEDEVISGINTVADEFGSDAGTSPGMECWIVDSGHLRRIDDDDMGTFYDADCYVLLHTGEVKKTSHNFLTQSVHTWAGSRAQKDKVTIAAYKAQQLCKYLGDHVPLTANVEDEETDSFVDMLFGNIRVMNGSIAQSSSKQVSSHKEDAVRLLEVSAGTSNSVLSMLGGSVVPYMHPIAIDRSNLKTNSALLLDTGQDVIYQWRGAQASHVSRARVFEAAFSLRSERIKQFPNCKIEVFDEGSEPDNFWQVFDANAAKPKRRNSEKSTMSAGSRNTVSTPCVSGSDEEGASEDEEISCESDQGDETFEEEFLYVDDHGDEDDNVIYDMDDIKEYCAAQIDGHTEMQRRQVASKSRVLNPEALGFGDDADESFLREEDTEVSMNIETSLYQIGYVDGKLQTSRLCGVNSAGEDFGLPRRELLDSQGVFILDFNDEVYVWMGKNSMGELRIAGTTVATALVQQSKAEWVEVVTLLEDEESVSFKAKFPDWYDSRQITNRRASWFQQRTEMLSKKRLSAAVVHESVKSVMGSTRKKRHRKSRTSIRGQMVCRSSIMASERQPLDDILDQDDGKGVTVIWKIVNAELQSIPRHEHGHFWTHETYVILYGFTLPKPEKEDGAESSSDESEETVPQFVLYFWQGPHSKEKAYPQWKLGILPGKITEWTEQMGHVPQEIRIDQGRETPHFFRIFRHRYVVHIPFVGIVKHRLRAEAKVRQVQTEILKREKLRWNMLPVPRRNTLKKSAMLSPSSSRSLLSAARNSSKHCFAEGSPRKPLSRNSSFSSIDSSVADDISMHVSPLPKACFQMETAAGVMLFHIRGLGICPEDVHAVQIEARASRLNSSDCFVCIRPYVSGRTFVWLWVGRGSQFFEQEAAGSIALVIKKWVDENSSRNQVRVVEEGAGEWFNKWIAKSFYKALGGFDLYTNFDLLQTPRYLRPLALRYPQLFLVENTRGEYVVTMVERCCQYDLSSTGAVIMDAHYALFVWSGKACSASLRVTAIRIAKRFMGSLRKGLRRLDRQVVEVEQGQEPGPFISCFHGWCDWDLLTRNFIDPRAIRFDQRARMGMLGDMAAYVGKPIEGLTTAQHEGLAKEYKKRLERERKKAAAAKPQKESIRDRLRQVALQKQEEQKEAANIAAGLPPRDPPKIVPDASYRSDYHVPPPDSIYASVTPRKDTSVVCVPRCTTEVEVKQGEFVADTAIQLTPLVNECDDAIDVSPHLRPPVTPEIGESVASTQRSRPTPTMDTTRLASSARTPSRTPPASRDRSTGSFIRRMGVSPVSPTKTQPRPGSSTGEDMPYHPHQSRCEPNSRRGTVSARTPLQPNTAAGASRRHTGIPKLSNSIDQNSSGASGRARESAQNLCPEETNGFFSRFDRLPGKVTPRGSIGSASGSKTATPFVADTLASKLRREKNKSKISLSTVDPLSLLVNKEEKAGRKPYHDYLRNPGAGPKSGEKKMISNPASEVQQKRRYPATNIAVGANTEQRRRSSAYRTKPP